MVVTNGKEARQQEEADHGRQTTAQGAQAAAGPHRHETSLARAARETGSVIRYVFVFVFAFVFEFRERLESENENESENVNYLSHQLQLLDRLTRAPLRDVTGNGRCHHRVR